MLSGASPKIGVEIKSENGNTLYKKETDQDTVTMTAPSKDTYRMCFYPVFDMIALDNIVFFDIDPGNPRHYESDIFQNVSSLEKHIMETLTETEMLLNHFNMKLEMNHGDLTNDILVVSNLKNKSQPVYFNMSDIPKGKKLDDSTDTWIFIGLLL
ncbi:hypothetical protein HZS_2214 [Henneguya salminicola]|nr:hypothetical protein HZS_2214 [Henneguya salminicola]